MGNATGSVADVELWHAQADALAAALNATGASLLAAAQFGADSVAGVELSPRQADALAAFLNATGASLPTAKVWRAKADALAASMNVTGASLLAAAQLGVDSVAAGVELSPRQA